MQPNHRHPRSKSAGAGMGMRLKPPQAFRFSAPFSAQNPSQVGGGNSGNPGGAFADIAFRPWSARAGKFNLNPAVKTANRAKYTNGQTVLAKRPFPCRVKGEPDPNTGVCLFFSRGSRGSRFGPTAVFRFKLRLSPNSETHESPVASYALIFVPTLALRL